MIKRCPESRDQVVPVQSTLELIIRFFYLEYKPRWYLPPDSVVTSTSREKYFSDEIKIGNHDMKAELASVVYKSVGIVISDVTSVVLQTLELRETNQN